MKRFISIVLLGTLYLCPCWLVATGTAIAKSPKAKEKKPSIPWRIAPHVIIVGGLEGEFIIRKTGENSSTTDQRENRVTTRAMSRFGLTGGIGDWLYAESEFEVNAGLHGTSTWEGQIAMQVRNQFLRLQYKGFRIAAGRVTDPSSLDYFSIFIADQLLTDPYTRNWLITTGFNRGNGILTQYSFLGGMLTAGFNFNAGNPTSNTATAVLGGVWFPYERPYFVPWERVGRDARGFPDDAFHIMVFTPSVRFRSTYIDAQVSAQFLLLNTNANITEDEDIFGYNLRAGVRVKLLKNRLRIFANFSRVTNGTRNPDDRNKLRDDLFVGMNINGGFDLFITRNFGLGGQYAFYTESEGGSVTDSHFANFGATYWLFPKTAISARVGMYMECTDGICNEGGAVSFFLSARTTIGFGQRVNRKIGL